MGSVIWVAVKRYWALLLLVLIAMLAGSVIGYAIAKLEFNAAQTKSAKALSDKRTELAELKITYANEKRTLAEKQSQALAVRWRNSRNTTRKPISSLANCSRHSRNSARHNRN